MGLFDRFKKQEQNVQKPQKPQQPALPYDIKLKVNEEGKIQIDFYDKNAEFKQFYDSTRLIIDNEKRNMGNIPIKECRISWYGKDDSIMIDREGNEQSRRVAYQNIMTEIDIGLLQTDPNYCMMLMKNLLNKSRVEKYLNEGLKESPDIPCGKYVGGVRVIENKYRKYFDPQVGKVSHNSQEMKDKRTQYREALESAKQQIINEKQQKMARLQEEIDELSR